MAQIGKNAAVPSNMDDTMETRVLMDSIFLMKIAQYELNAKEQFQLGIFLKLPTSTVDTLIGASEDAVANTFKMLETWLNSSKDVSNSTVLFDQLTGACMEIKRADLVNSVRCEQICLLSQRLKKAKEIAPSCRRKCNEQIRLAKAEERRAKEELQKCMDEVQRLNDLVRQYGNPEEPATAHPEERTEPLGDAAETPVHPEVRTHQLEAASTTPDLLFVTTSKIKKSNTSRIMVLEGPDVSMIQASTVDRIEALKAAAEPVDGGDNKDKKLRALHVMSMLKEYKQPKLWGYVSHHFVKKGELDVSKVLSSSNLPNLIFILTSNVTSNITKLDFGDNGIFCNEEAGHSLGAALASMSQLSLLRMPQCCVSDGSFRHIADGLLRGCHQMTLLNLQRNSLTDAGSEGRVKDLLTQMPVLTIVLTSSGLSVECGHRLRMAFGVRFLAF